MRPSPPQLQFFGFTVCALVAALPAPPPDWRLGGVSLDATRLPGLLLALFHAALFAALFATRSALWSLAPTRPPVATEAAGDDAAAPAAPPPDSLTAPLLPLACPDDPSAVRALAARRATLLALGLSLVNLWLRLTLAVLETLGSSVFYHLWHAAHPDTDPNQKEAAALVANAVFWGAVGCLGLLSFGALFAASRRGASDRALLAIGALLSTLGASLCVDWAPGAAPLRLPRFAAGIALAWGLGYPLAQTAAVSALSKALRADRMGTFLAYQTMAGSLGRVLGPLAAGALYDGGTGAESMALAAASCAACAAMVAGLWWRLQ